jgi:pimeloyl-ACP methyl ester carboxylesterase
MAVQDGGRRARRAAVTITAVMLAVVALAPAAEAKVDVRFQRLAGFDAPNTPLKYDRVGVLKLGPRRARNVLVLNPGTSASAAYFAPVARTIAARAKGWQVWAVERRENLLEDHSVLNRAKSGRAGGEEMFNYYLGWLSDPSVTDHFRLIPTSEVGFGREWGMRVEIEDLRRVVRAARRGGRKVVLGGHSLGGTITTAYATWDFAGRPGARDLAGLVYIDGGSRFDPVTEDEARQSLADLQAGSPWLSFGGIAAPFAGLFNASGSTGVFLDPNAPSRGQAFPLVPTNLKPPLPVTNVGQYGYALDTETSPPSLAAAQAHLGRLAPSGDPRGWVRAGEPTPIRRYARMFSGWGLRGLDGTAWYHPLRLTIDSGAVAGGNANPAQAVLDVRATHGSDLPRRLRIYAFGAALGGRRVLDAAVGLAEQSDIPRRNLTLVERASTYSHNDPTSAYPRNAFLARLVPFLKRIG